MAKIEAMPGEHISKVAEKAVDLVAAGEPEVKFEFNEIKLTVRSGMTAGDVVAEFMRIMNEQREAYLASPEYKEECRRAEEREAKRKAALDQALKSAPEKMTLRDESKWREVLENNTDPYGSAVLRYAELWARAMEATIAGGAKLEECAERLSHVADTEGITGYMYGAAVSILATVWIHGQALRIWHNKKYNVSEEKAQGGTVNPAILTIK